MMILEELWKGNIAPIERAVLKNSEYQKISHEAIEIMNEFNKELSAKGLAAFDEYCDKKMQLTSISEQDAFIKGVRLGAQLILDILGEYPSQLPQI